jgi:hypothetical protein
MVEVEYEPREDMVRMEKVGVGCWWLDMLVADLRKFWLGGLIGADGEKGF